MSFRNRFQQQQPSYRESLTYEEIIRTQVQRCIENFNVGDKDAVMFSVEALALSVNQKMADQEFRDSIIEMGKKWEVVRLQMNKDHRRQLKAAMGGCPDLIEKPSVRPDIDYWKEMYCVCLDLFQRKGLLLKERTNAAL